MKINVVERIAVVVLAAFLLIGALILHRRHSRPLRDIYVVEDGIKEVVTLKKLREIYPREKININTANAEQLKRIPGIGEKTAAKIIRMRETCGRFNGKKDIFLVRGIGDKKYESIKEYIEF